METNLKVGDPLQLTLACDPRLSSPNYLNDIIWEVKLTGGSPAAVSIETTFGLRAQSMRLFPRFQTKGEWIASPAEFEEGPRVIRLFPNLCVLEFSPIKDLVVQMEYWAVESNLLVGRITFINNSRSKLQFGFEWIGLLSHLGDGAGMAVKERGIIQVLEGKTSDLRPVCVMTGGPRPGSGPFAGLAQEVELGHGASHQLIWALAAAADADESLSVARQATTRPMDAEIGRIELLESSQTLTISTGNPDWDAALALSLRAANSLFMTTSGPLPNPSFVLTRQPENGFSLRGDGMDYNHLWNGQTALDTWYLTSLLGTAQPERCAGLIENFIASKREDGCLDWKPGLAGQRAKRLAQPILAETAWRLYRVNSDSDWLARIYPALMDFVRCWFSPAADRDQDGFPEWEHPFQPGLDESPMFHPWLEGSQGVDPEVVESPSLAAMLYRECTVLQQMAQLLSKSEDHSWLENRRLILKAEMEKSWVEESGLPAYRDARYQDSPKGEQLLSIRSTGTYPVQRAFASPRRLVLSFLPRDEMTRQSFLLISGLTPEGPVTEEVTPRSIHWLHGAGRYTTSHHFTRVIEVVARAMLPGDVCRIQTIDFTCQDLSLLLPLWADMIDAPRAAKLVEDVLLKRYLRPYGLPVCPPDHCTLEENAAAGVWMIWNQLIGEGLLNYGYRKEAANLCDRLLQSVTAHLKTEQAFSSAYHCENGQGQGERNTLHGLAPVGFFLKILGLEAISPNRVVLNGLSPFPHPINVQYRGTVVVFYTDHTEVVFPGGQLVRITEPGTHEISLS